MKTHFTESDIIYAKIVGADIDADGNGHLLIEKHRASTMEKTILELRKYLGKDVAIFVSAKK